MKKLFWVFLTFISITFTARSQKKTVLSTVTGKIVDINTNKAIEGVVVSILDFNLIGETDVNGKFKIENVPSGYHRLYAFSYDYKAYIGESFLVSPVTPNLIEIQLLPLNVKLKEALAKAPTLKAPNESPMSIRRIGSEEIDLTPGATRDISKVVQVTPGVVPLAFGNRNDLIVRGGSANENRYFLDGIEIPVLNHFAVQGGSGGNASLVNTELLQDIRFYTGSFPVEFSNGISSILDMRMRNGNSDKFRAKLVVGGSDIGLNIDAPISKNGKTTLIASYRRSYLQFLFSALKLPFLPTYNDYQFKINSKLSDRDEIYLLGIGSFDNNELNKELGDLDDSQRYILGYLPNNDQTSYTFGLGYKRRYKGAMWRTVLSTNFLDNRLFKYKDNIDNNPYIIDQTERLREYKFRSEYKIYNLKGYNIKFGLGLSYGKLKSETLNNNIYNYSQNDIFRYSIYATANKKFIADKLNTSISLRADANNYSSLTNNLLKQVSPRIGISYEFKPNFKINASVDRTYQEPTYTSMSIEANKIGLKYLALNSYALGIDYDINIDSKLKIEAFIKQYSQLPISLKDSLPITSSDTEASVIGKEEIKSTGKGHTWGVEFGYRNLDFRNTIINLSYTFMTAQYNKLTKDLKSIEGEYWDSPWNINHVVNISAIHKFKSNWTLGAKWVLVGGLPYTPYDFELSSIITEWANNQNRPYIDNTKYNQEKTGNYHQLDIRVDKVWYFNKLRLGFYLDIQNVYNTKVEKQSRYMPQNDVNGNYIINPSDPTRYLMKEVESDYGGTILPTFGLTIEI